MPSAQPVLLVPLYIYPLPGAWDPLVDAARAHPSVSFLCVVNPNNGPGIGPLPDASYQAALATLGELPNVQLLGYAHCLYGKREVGAIERDIETYAAWGLDNGQGGTGIRIDGIFLDETPWQGDGKLVEYMASIARFAKSSRLGRRPEPESVKTTRSWEGGVPASHPGNEPIVVFNPGVVVDRAYFDAADYIVVFEQSEKQWHDYFLRQGQGLAQVPPERLRQAVAVVHTCGQGIDGINSAGGATLTTDGAGADADSGGKLGTQQQPPASALAKDIADLGFGGLYLTHQLGGGYTIWPTMWSSVVLETSARALAQQG